jgi:Predicted amidophosphoribosyltransferases
MSAFYFGKGSVMQKLIHEFKYKANKELGEFLGTMMGELLLESDRFKNIDAVIPLPLFAAKEYKRGFNQATILSNGISKAMNIPVVKNNVTRKRFTETQTKKHRTDRWENVSGSFEIIQPDLLTGKHILLVDDVVTTGATLEACGTEILKMKETKLSIATLAFASK